MEKRKWSQDEVDSILSLVTLNLEKKFKKILVIRTFASCLVGSAIIFPLYVYSIPLPTVIGSFITALIFYTIDQTLNLISRYFNKDNI